MAVQNRIAAFDHLRALMMWLGIALHSLLLYMQPNILLPNSADTSVVSLSIFAWIHTYRMPLFFILAGFFTVLSLQSRADVSATKKRFIRLVVPFFITLIASHLFVTSIVNDHILRWGLAPSLVDTVPSPYDLMHLWFLYYLIIYTVLGNILYHIGGKLTGRLNGLELIEKYAVSWQSAALFGLLGCLLSIGYEYNIIKGNNSPYSIDTSFLFYGLYFVFGAAIYVSRNMVLERIKDRCWSHFILASAVYFVSNILGLEVVGVVTTGIHKPLVTMLFSCAYYLATWLWCVFFIGLFLKYYNQHSRIGRYLGRSAYWVYLVHYPLTIAVAAWLYGRGYSPSVNIVMVIVCVSCVSLISYELVSRRLLSRVAYS